MFNVPQYIDVEDKVAGPLTGKQLLWMIGMGATLLILWNIFSPNVFYVLLFPVIFIFVAFAFFRPYGMPLLDFTGHFFLFLFHPKVYMWNRLDDPTAFDIPIETKKETPVPKKELTPERISELSRIIDRKRI